MSEIVFLPLLIRGFLHLQKIKVSNTKWKLSAITFSATLVTILVATGLVANSIPIDKIQHSYSYSIRISTNGSGEYYVLIPAPIVYDPNPNVSVVSPIAYHFKIVGGKGNISITQTVYGNALNISSNNTIELIVEGKYDDESFYSVSLKNRSDNRMFLMYCNKTFSDEITISASGYDEGIGGRLDFNITGAIKENGWNDVYGKLIRRVV
jgi:hypothetical protein